MQDAEGDNWREERLKGFSRVMRLGLAGALVVGSVVLFAILDPALRSEPLVLLLLAGLIASGIYDIARVFRERIFWNETGIRRVGLFRTGRVLLWDDLTEVARAPQQRATLLTFGLMRKLPVPWAYRGHREIMTLAKARLKERKAGRGKKQQDETPAPAAPETVPAAVAKERVEPKLSGGKDHA